MTYKNPLNDNNNKSKALRAVSLWKASSVAMCSSWSKLPSEVADKLFTNFTIRELKTLSLVCHDWFIAVDSFWRSKIAINEDFFKTEERRTVLLKSNRNYVNLKLNHNDGIDLEKVTTILGAKNNLEYLSLVGFTVNEVSEIIQSSGKGKSLETLHLSFSEFRSHSCDFEVPKYDFENLSSLTLSFYMKEFEPIASFIKNLETLNVGLASKENFNVFRSLMNNNVNTLKNLYILCKGDSEMEEHLLDLQNLKLERFDLTTDFEDKTNIHRNIIKNQKSLKCLHLVTNDFTEDDLSEISLNLKELEDLFLEGFNKALTKQSLRTIWNIPTLKVLELHGFIYSKEDFLEILSPKPTLKTLIFSSCIFDDDIAEKLFENCPSLEMFISILVREKAATYRSIQEAADKLESLEYLSILSDNLKSSENLKNGSFEIRPFKKLKCLTLNNSDINELCLDEIIAPELKILDLSCITGLSAKGVMTIAEKFPTIHDLNFFGCEGISDLAILEISKKLKFLKRIILYGSGLSLKSFAAVVENCRHLENADFRYIERGSFSENEFEDEVRRICQLRRPPLTLETHKEGNSQLFNLASDTTEIVLSYELKSSD
ncbi:hypothetical protein ACFFRR_010565 [Megaselia abdita]